MTVLRGFFIIAISGLLCATVGAGIGLGLGAGMPNFYRNMFPNGNAPDFDPVQMGFGLGLTQGLTCGVIVGGIVVMAVAWYNARRHVVIFDSPAPPAAFRTASSRAIW